MASTLEVGRKLVELCRKGQFDAAVRDLYAQEVVSIEAGSMDGSSPRTVGLANVIEKGKKWSVANEVHGCEVGDAFPHGDRFIVIFKLDVTSKFGPFAGKRMTMEEAALYTVKDGKIVKEEFFYPME
jgi:ketosteroid isomerase-like protein